MAKKNEKFTKIYRQFTRVKYEKYRLQFPRVRQSQLIQKIVKQWEAMDDGAKQDLQRKYDQGSIVNFTDSPSSSDKKNQQKAKKPTEPAASSAKIVKQKKIAKPKKPSPKVKVFVQSSIKKSSPEQLADFANKQRQNSKSPGKKSTPDKGQSSSSQIAIKNAVGSGTGNVPGQKEKSRAEEYQNFYKYYYERLKSEHPRWSKQQITTIIRLLWRKRGGNKTIKRKKSVSGKSLSGRQLYTKTKLSEGMPKQQIKQLWRALPHESKKYWQIKGQGRPNISDKISGKNVRRVLNLGASKQAARQDTSSNLSWMHNK